MLRLDHLAVACTDLAEGTDWVERQLGVPLQPGGRHVRYGTHNNLLGLADGLYLEVIAKDPSAAPIEGPTWFALDQFSGPPRLANWICCTDDLDTALAMAPTAVGVPRSLARGDLRWQITVPDDGSLPFDGAFPTLIQWAPGTAHPASRLPDSGCRLVSFEVWHPQIGEVTAMMDLRDTRVRFHEGPIGFRVIIDAPDGERTLT